MVPLLFPGPAAGGGADHDGDFPNAPAGALPKAWLKSPLPPGGGAEVLLAAVGPVEPEESVPACAAPNADAFDRD